MIPYGRQDITDEDVAAVVAALKSDFITQGPAIGQFEAALAAHCGAARAVAVSSATAALHIAYQALGVGPGDIVWTVPNTFAATANAALYLGATVDFVDIDMETRNLSLSALTEKFEQAERIGRLPKIVAPVHFAGLSCDMEPIGRLCRKYGARIVEDASHAVGASYDNTRVGACAHSDVTIFSFHPVKIITTGEGGMALTADPELGERIALLRTHGITRDPSRYHGKDEGPWYYQMVELGFNYRITDIQAALGASQVKRLDHYVERRNRLAEVYDVELRDCGAGLPGRFERSHSAFHLYSIHWPDGLGGHSRRSAFEAMRKAGIGVNVHYIPVHLLTYYRELGFRQGQWPVSEAHYNQAISIPLFATLAEGEQARVIDTIRSLSRGDEVI